MRGELACFHHIPTGTSAFVRKTFGIRTSVSFFVAYGAAGVTAFDEPRLFAIKLVRSNELCYGRVCNEVLY